MPIDMQKLKDEYKNSQGGKDFEAAINAFVSQTEADCLQAAKSGKRDLKVEIPDNLPDDQHTWYEIFQPLVVNIWWDNSIPYLHLSGWDK